jgi:hypothetical protein
VPYAPNEIRLNHPFPLGRPEGAAVTVVRDTFPSAVTGRYAT